MYTVVICDAQKKNSHLSYMYKGCEVITALVNQLWQWQKQVYVTVT